MIAINRAGARVVGSQGKHYLIGAVLVAGEEVAEVLSASFSVFL